MSFRTKILWALAPACLSLAGCSSPSEPASYTLQLNPGSVVLTLRSPSASINVNATITQKGIVTTGPVVTWKSSDETVATVTATGQAATITAQGHGTATVTASADGAPSSTVNVSVISPDCQFNIAGEATVTPGTPSTGALANSDCRRGDSPADIYKLQVTGVTNNVTINATGTGFGPRVALFRNNGADSLAGNIAAAQTATVTGLLAPGTYWIAVGGPAPSTSGAYSLNVALTPIVDQVCSATNATSTITAAPSPVTISGNLSVTDCVADRNTGFGDVYRLTVTGTANVQMDVASTQFNTQVILVDSNFAYILGDDNAGGGTNARLLLTLSAGTYYIVATSFGAGVLGTYTLTVRTL
jgi:hypothetical protein